MHLACCNEVDASVSLSIAQLGNVPLPSCRIGLQILCPKADKPPTGSERVSRQSRQRPDAPPRRISVTHCSLIICPHGNVLWPKTGACKCNQSPQGTLHKLMLLQKLRVLQRSSIRSKTLRIRQEQGTLREITQLCRTDPSAFSSRSYQPNFHRQFCEPCVHLTMMSKQLLS